MDALSLPVGVPWTAELADRLARYDAALWVLDPDRATIVWANAAGVAHFAAPSLELLRRRQLRGSPDVPDPSRIEGYRAALERGEVVLDTWRPDGAPTLVSSVTLTDGRLGLLCRQVGSAARAPSAPRLAQLEAKGHLLESLFDALSTFVLVVDPEGRISRANRAARAGLGGAQLMSRPVWESCGGPAKAQLEAWVERGQAPDAPFEVALDTPTGRRQVLWTARIERDEAAAPYLLLSGVDTTALREAETRLQASDRLASIGTLAAGLAHDLNNPLAYVITNAEMVQEELQRRAIDPELEAMIAECLEGARRAASIVGQLQTFAKGSASGRAGIAHVRSVVDFAARMAHNHAKHSARVEVDCPDDLFATIDESALGQVVLNLLVHALSSIPVGQADRHEVRVQARRLDRGDVALTVADDGEGLTPEALRSVFDPYRSTKTPTSGYTAMGLAISQRLVTEAGGRIDIDSHPDRGTIVQVHLRGPNAPDAITQRPRRRVPTTPPPRRGDGAHILIVDDEERLRGVLRRTLRGYRLDGASNGREALERIREHRYDLVLCDVMMPEMTGPELYEQLRAEHPDLAARVIFLSGGAFTPETQAFLDETPCPVVDKPFQTRALRSLVAETLGEPRPPSG